jgi:tetratricopeptide (TPR) repeat protein
MGQRRAKDRGVGMLQSRDARLRWCRFWSALLLAATLSFSAWALAADQAVSSLPDLPQIVYEQFPPGMHGELERAYNAVKANPNDATLNGNLGMVFEAHNPADLRAEICYRRAHVLDPSSFRWGYYLGLVLAAEGEYEEAVVTLRDALRIDPEYLPARLNLGECLLASGKWQEAGELFVALVREYPDSPLAHYGLARVKSVRNDLNGAADSYRTACKLFPSFGAAHYGLARVYERLNNQERSQEEMNLYNSTRGSAPGLKDELLAKVAALNAFPMDEFFQAEALTEQGKISEAAVEYERALAINPKLEKAHVHLIFLYGRLGQVAKAEEHFQAAARLDPNDPECYFNRGLLLASEERYSEAEQAFRKALETSPHYPESHTNLGYMLEAQGKLSEAAAEYERAIADAPDDPQAHFALGRIAVSQDDYAEGIRHFLICLRAEKGGNRPAYLYALGAAYARSGNRNNALQYLREAREGAAALGQSKLEEAIQDDLKRLEEEAGP